MTTPRPAPFPTTTPRAGVLVSFIILSNSDDAITTLPIRPAPPSPDYQGFDGDYRVTSYPDCFNISCSTTITLAIIFTTTTATSNTPPPERVESVRDDVETMRASLASAEQENATLCARVESLEQHNMITRDSLRTARGRITRLQLRALRSLAKYAEARLEESHERQTRDGVRT
ncbi:hypothetical protein Tco_0369866, partial [Tanacetum coccineum]